MATSGRCPVIFLHGLGGYGASLAPVAASWRASMPNVAFASPDAPFNYPGSGHQWFGVDGRELTPDRIALVRAAFDGVIAGEIQRAGFDGHLTEVAFLGVSQGAIVALDAVASGRWPVRAVVTFAGLLPPGPISPKAKGTEVLMIHGGGDQTIPALETTRAAERLSAAGLSVDSIILPGVGHTVTVEGLDVARRFLSTAMSVQTPT